MTDKVFISWDDFYRDAKILCSKIEQRGQFDKIVAVSRGGFFVAGVAAYQLEIRRTSVVNIIGYVGENRLPVEKIENLDSVGPVDEKTLILDDLSDSGRTFCLLKKTFPKATTAALYAKKAGRDAVELVARDMPDNWIVFPWDL